MRSKLLLPVGIGVASAFVSALVSWLFGLATGPHSRWWPWIVLGSVLGTAVALIIYSVVAHEGEDDGDKGAHPNPAGPSGNEGGITQNVVQTGGGIQTTIGQQNIGQQFNMSPVAPQPADVVHKNAEFSYNDGNGLETNGLTVETEGIKAIGNKGSGAVHNGPVRDRNSEYGYNGIGGMFLGPGSGRPRPAPSQNDQVGRSDPCPCGSGKKSKLCCG